MSFTRLLFLTAFLIQLGSCAPPPENEGESNTTPAPDRAAAAADGSMALTPAAVGSETVFDYEDILWGFQFLPDGRIIATDKGGKVLLITNDGTAAELSGVPPVKNVGQGGLLDVLPHPDFAANRTVFFTYSEPAPDDADRSGTAVASARLSPDDTALENWTVLYRISPKTTKNHHYGSRMVFHDGHLFFTVGDRGERERNPQDLSRDGGKVYRIAPDGSIPADNPFADRDGAKTATWSYGHRNLQGLAIHPETGALWEHEHGPRGGDEINLIEPGKNYGWPEITYGINYDGSQITEAVAREGMEQPLHYWVPSIAPSGMAFVTGERYPGWSGDLIVGSLKFMYLRHVALDGQDVTGEQILLKNLGRARDVRSGPDGWIYASIEGVGIVRVTVK